MNRIILVDGLLGGRGSTSSHGGSRCLTVGHLFGAALHLPARRSDLRLELLLLGPQSNLLGARRVLLLLLDGVAHRLSLVLLCLGLVQLLPRALSLPLGLLDGLLVNHSRAARRGNDRRSGDNSRGDRSRCDTRDGSTSHGSILSSLLHHVGGLTLGTVGHTGGLALNPVGRLLSAAHVLLGDLLGLCTELLGLKLVRLGLQGVLLRIFASRA